MSAGGRAQAVDALTPLGRGQALLVTGGRRAGKTALVLDAVLAQARSDVRCVYAAVGQGCAGRAGGRLIRRPGAARVYKGMRWAAWACAVPRVRGCCCWQTRLFHNPRHTGCWVSNKDILTAWHMLWRAGRKSWMQTWPCCGAEAR